MYQSRLAQIPIMVIMINKLTIKNITQEFIDNIAFIFVSYPGSLGPDGTVEFVLKNTDSYKCNVAYRETDNYFDYDLLKKSLIEYNFDFDMDRSIDGFEKVYLGGCGNDLYIKDKYALEFYRFTYGSLPVKVFQEWREIANYILCTQ